MGYICAFKRGHPAKQSLLSGDDALGLVDECFPRDPRPRGDGILDICCNSPCLSSGDSRWVLIHNSSVESVLKDERTSLEASKAILVMV